MPFRIAKEPLLQSLEIQADTLLGVNPFPTCANTIADMA